MFAKLKFLFFFFIAADLYAAAFPVLQASRDSCEFYRQFDKQKGCSTASEDSKSLSNYLMGYGFKYCDIYLTFEREEGLSEALINWLRDTRLCLQQTFSLNVEALALSCDEIGKLAFESHSICYQDSGFNNLSFKEKKQVCSQVAFEDILSHPLLSLGQAYSICAGSCILL